MWEIFIELTGEHELKWTLYAKNRCGRSSILWRAPSRPLQMRISRLGHNLFRRERGWRVPLMGNAPSLSPKWLLLGMVCAGIHSMHAYLINPCQKAEVIQKQVLPIVNNWRNTEICPRSGSVCHADTRGSLRCVSWGKEFTPYTLNLNIQFISTALC